MSDKPIPICRIARENGGDVPLDCLFGCARGCHNDRPVADADDGRGLAPAFLGIHCNRCGSTDVRWRQQGGKWTLFSSKPGVLHVCPITDDFEDLTK